MLIDTIAGLIRLPWTVLGHLSERGTVGGALERLAASAEGAAGLLEVLNAEANVRRALAAPARLERLAVAAERAATLLEVMVNELEPERVRVAVAQFDRLAASAERAAVIVDRIEAEIDVERLGETIGRIAKLTASAEEVASTVGEVVGPRLTQSQALLDRLVEIGEEMNRNIRLIERLLEGVRSVVNVPLQNLPIPSVLRRGRRDRNTEETSAE
jgi:predicted component of type VI protein secretion system